MKTKIKYLLRGIVILACIALGIAGLAIIWAGISFFTSYLSTLKSDPDIGALVLAPLIITLGCIFVFISYRNIFNYSAKSIDNLSAMIFLFTIGISSQQLQPIINHIFKKDEFILLQIVCQALPLFVGWIFYRLTDYLLIHYTLENGEKANKVEQMASPHQPNVVNHSIP